MAQDTPESLPEEFRVLPTRSETENFSSEVTRISMDVERLAARVKRLQAAHSDNTG